MTRGKVVLTGLVVLLVGLGLAYAWGASGRSAAEDALAAARRQVDVSDARGHLLAARVSLYNNNFGDASRSFEDAKTTLRRVREAYVADDRDDAVAAIDTALKQTDEAQRLAGKLDQTANARAADALKALDGLPR